MAAARRRPAASGARRARTAAPGPAATAGRTPGGDGGGGGGAGCFGGGGGGISFNGPTDGGSGGGGGSTCVDASVSDFVLELGPGGDGQVVIEYTLPSAPAIISAASASFTVGAAGSHTITSSGNPPATITLDNPAALPPGLTFVGGMGSATISGTPAGPAGASTVKVRAANGTQPDATQDLTITVVAAPAPAPSPSPSPSPTPTPTPKPNPKAPAAILSAGGGTVAVPPNVEPVRATTTEAVAVALGCTGPGGTTCSGKVAVSVRVRKRGKKILAVLSQAKTRIVRTNVGTATYTIAAGRFKTVRVKLNRNGRALLKRFGRLKVTVRVTVTTSYGAKQLTSKRVTIKRKRARRR